MSSQMTYPATVIYPDGTSKEISLALAADVRLHAIQKLFGECVEGIPLSAGRYMFLEENGKDDPHTVNHVATEIARRSECIMANDYIAGVAVIVPMELPEQCGEQ